MAVAAPTFTGFRSEAIQFLADLAENIDPGSSRERANTSGFSRSRSRH